jgi:hypothetical protein
MRRVRVPVTGNDAAQLTRTSPNQVSPRRHRARTTATGTNARGTFAWQRVPALGRGLGFTMEPLRSRMLEWLRARSASRRCARRSSACARLSLRASASTMSAPNKVAGNGAPQLNSNFAQSSLATPSRTATTTTTTTAGARGVGARTPLAVSAARTPLASAARNAPGRKRRATLRRSWVSEPR